MTKLIKNDEEIEKIKGSGKILAFVLRRLKTEAKLGTRLLDLEKLSRELLKEAGARPTFLGYRSEGAKEPFPFALCTSVNEIIVHGRPSDYQLKSGDLLKLDLGVNWRGGIADAAVTIPIGKVSEKIRELVQTTQNALAEAIRAVKPGSTVGDIGFAVERVVKKGGGEVIEGLTGHGVGLEVHEDPVIHNFGQPGTGLELKEGMVLAIEPMVSLTTGRAVQMPDDSFVTSDGSPAAHFEHTVLVVKSGSQILTL